MIGCSGSRCWSHSPFQLSVEERATARGWGGPKLEMWLSPMSPHAGTAVLRGAGSISSTECVGATKLRKRGSSRANAAKIPGKRSLLCGFAAAQAPRLYVAVAIAVFATAVGNAEILHFFSLCCYRTAETSAGKVGGGGHKEVMGSGVRERYETPSVAPLLVTSFSRTLRARVAGPLGARGNELDEELTRGESGKTSRPRR